MKQTSLQGIANKAATDKAYQFRNLFGMLTAGFLFLCGIISTEKQALAWIELMREHTKKILSAN